jgi:hypothetical protein
MGDADVEGPPQNGSSILKNIDAPEVVPESNRNLGQKQSTLAATAVRHRAVAFAIG